MLPSVALTRLNLSPMVSSSPSTCRMVASVTPNAIAQWHRICPIPHHILRPPIGNLNFLEVPCGH